MMQHRTFQTGHRHADSASKSRERAADSDDAAPRRPRAFVLLARGSSGEEWNRRYHDGSLIGFNEAWPYGYFHAADMGYDVEYSQDCREGPLRRFARLSARAVFGFDLVHAWRNRDGFRRADVVWTHTESQSLSAAALHWLGVARPKLLLQSVWLIDRWDRLLWHHRWIARRLLRRADVLTFLSPLNTERARRLFPRVRCELVLFGIRCAPQARAGVPRRQAQLNVLSLGSDRHRDWATLLRAVGQRDDVSTTIVSGSIPKKLLAGTRNCRVVRPRHNAELDALYAAADVVVVALKPNLHASGITVAEEAAVKGRALVISDVGGLRGYFDGDSVLYVPAGDAQAIVDAIERVRSHPEQVAEMAGRAQARMSTDDLSSVSYARRHVALSDELLGRAPAMARADVADRDVAAPLLPIAAQRS